MNYINFMNLLQDIFSGLTINNLPYIKYIEQCHYSEIENNPLTLFPSVFITPIDFDIISEDDVQYGAKVFIAVGLTGKTDRMMKYSECNIAVLTVLQTQTSIIFNYPINIRPTLKWDNAIDGIEFDIIIKDTSDCYR